MWKAPFINKSEINEINIESILSGSIPAIIIKNFYDEKSCKTIQTRISNQNLEDFQKGKSRHIGPFLMSYITKKKEYFEKAKQSQKILDVIFSGVKNPTQLVYESMLESLPGYSISLASEFQNYYSPCVIRIHEKNKSIPIHKDYVKYEGKEYHLADIDHQISCVLHLQESESGGDLIIYNKQWKKDDEKFRNVDFGYSSQVISSCEFCKISKINSGDLVIINPKYYHQVTKIIGTKPRITLGMFLGFYRRDHKIVAWA